MLNEIFEKTRKDLNSVGCGFCLAKWTQVTLHLQMGQTHSCHHPSPHFIPLEELKNNPSALHNTQFKKEQRKEMLEGGKPKECSYCWNIEDSSNAFSDRTYKSSEPWSKPFINEIKNLNWENNYNPKYVEVSFSNHCNYKCSYCGPSYSSQWMQEILQHGKYPTSSDFGNLEWLKSENKMPIPHNEFNPYVESFWKWWPDLYRDLHTFRITGGEPLLSKDTFKVLDYIIDNPNPNKNLNFSINTNLGAPDKLFNEFLNKIKRIIDEDRVNEVILFTSVDTWGNQAEYIRNGMTFNLVWDRINILLKEIPTLTIIIMSTYNALSVPRYKELIKNVYKLKEEYHNPYRYYGSSIILDSSYLRHPEHQTVKILDNDWIKEVKEQAQLMDFYEQIRVGMDGFGFTDIEINKLNRIHDWMLVKEDENSLKTNKKDFKIFVDEHDRRRGTNFVKTFPELEKFYHDIQ
jgi:MoaA/NifB/PqqE/SkfB family radical SAM enzyme